MRISELKTMFPTQAHLLIDSDIGQFVGIYDGRIVVIEKTREDVVKAVIRTAIPSYRRDRVVIEAIAS